MVTAMPVPDFARVVDAVLKKTFSRNDAGLSIAFFYTVVRRQ